MFSSKLFSRSDVEAVLQNVQTELTALIRHCMDPSAGGLTPSDLPDVDLGQEELDELLAEVALLDR